MDYEDWKFIKILHSTKNLTAAAKKLYVTQPALTKRLKVIEEQFGVKLADRTNKGIKLTAEGEYLAAQADRFLEELDEVQKQLQRIANPVRPLVRIGAPSSFMRYFLIDILSDFRDANPDIVLQVNVDVSSLMPEHIDNDELDCAFTLGDTQVQYNPYVFDTQECYAVYNKPIELADLPGLPLILHNRNQLTLNAVFEWWRDHFSEPPNISTHITSLDMALDIVSNGLGYTIAFSSFLKKRSEFHLLPLLHLDGTPLVRRTWFMHSDKALSNPYIGKFVSFVLGRIESNQRIAE